MQSPNTYFLNSDTIQFSELDYVFNEQLSVKKNLLHSSIYISEGELFSQSKVDKTHSTLNNLQNFRTINLLFEPVDSLGVDSIQLLDCKIELTPLTKQSYDIALEGTHSSGNLGMAGNLIYKHRNLFHGAESFELRFKGAIEFLTNSKNDFNRMIEYGVETRLNVPQFWLPIKLEALQKRYSPRTMLSFNYNYQSRPEITRTIAAAGFGYHWKSSRFLNHQINIVDLNYVSVTEMSERFSEIISGTYLEDSYRSHVISAFNYSFTFSNQKLNRQRNFFFVSFRPEVAGNLFSMVYGMSGNERPDGGYLFFDTPYSQYFMADIDFRYYRVINDANRLVFRLFAGAGYPFGNAEVMPFEKRYFSGGSNGIRAWQVRSLGPGSYILPADREDQYPNQLGDIKLESNFEYRFDLFWSFKGAVFLDAGNIWAIKPDLDQPGAEFSLDSFYNEIAVGTGFGLRLDLSFFVARLDLGIKLRDPSMISGAAWIPFSRSYGWDDFMLNFAIGYPF
ncbi:MAG: BamA/TamA family outer membrane protein [Bacteroidales bacterium]|nr:BamA/TamA family outer membrane protein [Bacteroidales bacterium]